MTTRKSCEPKDFLTKRPKENLVVGVGLENVTTRPQENLVVGEDFEKISPQDQKKILWWGCSWKAFNSRP